MIVIRRTNFTIKKVSELQFLSDSNIADIIKEESEGGIYCAIPSSIKTNKDRNIYRVGFITEFLKTIYPDKKFSDICEIMNIRYNVLIGRRQIERLYSKHKLS